MGLFDEILINYKLPLPEDLGELAPEDFYGVTWQTKDLDEGMYNYIIDERGLLYLVYHEGRYVDLPKNEAKSQFFKQKFVVEKEWNEFKNITSTINFYTSFPNWDKEEKDELKNDYWIEYQAILVEGAIKEVKIVKFEKEDNKERRARDKEFYERLKEREVWRKKWYIKYTYIPYCDIVRWLFRKTYKFLSWAQSNLFKAERFLTPW